jgi:CheY-like chemotaxis protein
MIRISTEPLGEGRERVVLRRFSAQAPEPAAFQVLVVDDDGAARRALAHDLAEAGLLVLQAADGVAALAYVKRLHPDVVLTEAALPRLDAIGMLAALAGLESAPVVVVRTEQRNDALASWLREAGAGAVLPHALPAVELAARLKELARGA